MPIKLLACDYDDTLTEGQGRVLPAVVDAIAAFVRRGGQFLLASGRIIGSLEKAVADWDIPCYLAGANGTVLKQWPGDKQIHALQLPAPIVRQALVLGNGFGVPHLFFDDRFYAPHSEKTSLYSRLLGVPFVPTGRIADHYGPGARAVIWRCAPDDTPKVEAILSKALGGQAHVTISHPMLVDVNPLGSGKHNALKRLQAMLAITPEDTLSIGDSPNDLGLMTHAAHRATPANGCEALKAKATFIADKPRGKGILQCFAHFGVLSDPS